MTDGTAQAIVAIYLELARRNLRTHPGSLNLVDWPIQRIP